MNITPDSIIFWQSGIWKINATIAYTWLVMAILVFGSWWVTRHLSDEPQISSWQNGLEIIIQTLNEQIVSAAESDPRPFLPYIGTLFLYVAVSNLLTLFPIYESPAGSLSTTTALALCTFVAVPLFAIREAGVIAYLRHYIQPSPFMLPFQIISEISRTISLAVRLFGNVMSTSLLVAILLSIVPVLFPAVLRLFGMLVGVIQAYVIAVLSLVYIASSVQTRPGEGSTA